MHSSTPLANNDLFTLITGGGDLENIEQSLESSLFHGNDHSPKTTSDNALSIPPFRPQSFTPPILEPSTKIETKNSEQQQQAPDVQTLLGAGSHFNVTNFLDGILSESTHHQHPTTISDEIVQQKLESAEVADPQIPFGATALGAVSLDPWNSIISSNSNDPSNNSSTKSINPLAALRGTVTHQEPSSIIAGIPLNNNAPSLLASTTTKLQNNTIATNANNGATPVYASLVVSEGGGDNDNDFLEPDSFYNQLLGEE